MTNALRNFARRFLPPSIRKPLGNLYGHLQHHAILPVKGLIFDLKGGRYKTNDCTFVIPRDITTLVFRAGFLGDGHEIDERQLVRRFVQPEDTVLELGGCLGVVSCTTNKLLRDPTRHVVVEANPYCLPALHRNRDLNKCSFLVENCAVGNQRDISFFLDPDYVVCGNAKKQSTVSVRVPGRSLNELLERYGPFSVLVMDVEGSELEVLESSTAVLRNFRLIIVEMHDWMIGAEGIGRCRELLQKAGFTLVERSFITEAWKRA